MTPLKSSLARALFLAAHLSAQTPAAPPVLDPPKDVKTVGSGLTFLVYPTQPSQINANNSTGYIPFAELIKLKPARAPKTVYTISTWEKPSDQNGIVMGYLKIDKPGLYGFRTESGYDRNELLIDDTIVCKMFDGENKGEVVTLAKGLHSIASVGYAVTTSKVTVQWMPPGETAWTDIPKSLFTHAAFTPPK
jgi:hypothetical protein